MFTVREKQFSTQHFCGRGSEDEQTKAMEGFRFSVFSACGGSVDAMDEQCGMGGKFVRADRLDE